MTRSSCTLIIFTLTLFAVLHCSQLNFDSNKTKQPRKSIHEWYEETRIRGQIIHGLDKIRIFLEKQLQSLNKKEVDYIFAILERDVPTMVENLIEFSPIIDKVLSSLGSDVMNTVPNTIPYLQDYLKQNANWLPILSNINLSPEQIDNFVCSLASYINIPCQQIS